MLTSLNRLQNSQHKALILTTCCWGLYFCYGTIHCTFYTTYVYGNDVKMIGALIWNLQESGHWLPLSYWLVSALNRLNWQQKKSSVYHSLYLCLMALLASISYRVGLDLILQPDATFTTSIAYFTHIQLNTLMFVMLFWFIAFRLGAFNPDTANQQPSLNSSNSNKREKQNLPITQHPLLEVFKGNQVVQLPIEDIDFISASGNYMEVTSNDNIYLLRATLKQLETQLPTTLFIRIHRSHLVNRNKITAIKNNTHVLLNTGKQLPLGIRYQSNVNLNILNQ